MKIEVSNGEILDKITILAIKLDKIKDPEKLANVKKELEILHRAIEGKFPGSELEELFLELKRINLDLWDIEDAIRKKEASGEFDDDFIKLARRVYFTNDRRSKVKQQINILTESDIIEEKDYRPY